MLFTSAGVEVMVAQKFASMKLLSPASIKRVQTLSLCTSHIMLRRIFTIAPIILLLGASLLLFFVNLVGATNKGVLGKFYLSQTDTSGIDGAQFQVTRWTLYNICEVKNNKNTNCVSASPAYPYSPEDNFGVSDGIPSTFVKSRNLYYYLSRFSYVFFLIGLFFALVTLLPLLLSCCTTGFFTGLLGTLTSGLALLFTTAGAACITAIHAKGKKSFNNDGHSTSMDTKMFAVMWAAVVCLLLTNLWTIITACVGGKKKFTKNHDKESVYDKHSSTSSEAYQYNGTVPESQYQQPEAKKFRFFQRAPREQV